MLFKRRGEKVKFSKILKNGIIDENPVLRLMLGMCPALAVTTSANNGLGMGLATTFVLICSNFVISSTRKIIPPKVRLPVFITVIATFVTIVQMLMKAYIPSLDKALGIFIPLIVVNCIILGRAEAFASKNSISASVVDGVGMGTGFTLALFIIGSVRELLGEGSFFGISLFGENFNSVGIMLLPPGGFLTFGIIVGLLNVIAMKLKKRKLVEAGCGNCPANCGNASANEGV